MAHILRIACRLETHNLTLRRYAHARGERKTATQAIDLTETTFNALIGPAHTFNHLLGRRLPCGHRRRIFDAIRQMVEVEIQLGQLLEMLDETVGIIIEDNTGIEQMLRIKDILQFLHDAERVLAPFFLHERSHVAAGAVLSLERAVIALHQRHNVSHHVGITLDFLALLETLI